MEVTPAESVDSGRHKTIISRILLYFSHFDVFDTETWGLEASLSGEIHGFVVNNPFILSVLVNNPRIGSQSRTNFALLHRDRKVIKR